MEYESLEHITVGSSCAVRTKYSGINEREDGRTFAVRETSVSTHYTNRRTGKPNLINVRCAAVSNVDDADQVRAYYDGELSNICETFVTRLRPLDQ
jgi:hypothetical protein